MPINSTTSSISMINLQMTGADGVGGVWHDVVQLIPHGMYDDPVRFVAQIKQGLPLVNNLRVLFNEHSFNPDGSLHPQMEAFLAEAAAQGFSLTICYGEGDAQNIGRGIDRWPRLTNAEAYAALQDNFSDMSGAWQSMMDWMAANPAVAAAVYGWELVNESAAYRETIRYNGAGDGLTTTDFVDLYTDHALALAQQISTQSDGKILVGGWGFNGDFATLANTMLGSQSALDALRAGVGSDLVWSAHLYPGWLDTGEATSSADLIARLEAAFAPVAGDDVIITEINAHGEVNNAALPVDYNDLFVNVYEWFAQSGIGLGWYPGLMSGASHLLYLESNGGLTYRHQHSLAHALNGFSLGQNPTTDAAGQMVQVSLVTARLRNENYEITAGEAQFDTVTKAGFAFGYAGNDTLQGTDGSADFLYGGTGNDQMFGGGADDFLYGQHGNDNLQGGALIDHLFGGHGHDTLTGGTGRDFNAGGVGNDVYDLDDTGDTVTELVAEGTDTVRTTLASYTLGDHLENLTTTGPGAFSGAGNALNNAITGAAAADILSGLDGSDRIYGNAGDDTLYGGVGADMLFGGLGADLIDGGTGGDFASYALATSAVRASLIAVSTGTTAGEAAGDRYVAIEHLEGSAFADVLTGNAAANTLRGLAGNDTFYGGAGADYLVGGDGLDLVSYLKATQAVIADLTAVTTGTAAGEAAGDRFSLVERLQGSNFADRLSGDAAANTIWGQSGNDQLAGRAGNDVLVGGVGDDQFVFALNDDADRVTDFQDNLDTLVFQGFSGVTTASQAMSKAVQSGANVIFQFGNGDTLTVMNTQLAVLQDDILII
jgi:Ca2+-binding RTX toxin-like protein